MDDIGKWIVAYFILMAVAGAVFISRLTSAKGDVERLKKEEERNAAKVAALRRLIDKNRDLLQQIRLGFYKPSAEDLVTARGLLKTVSSETTQRNDDCYFCATPLNVGALVCHCCGRGNVKLAAQVHEKDRELQLTLERLASELR